MIAIYTDGSYRKQHRVGGWAAILVNPDGSEIVSSGGLRHSFANAENVTAQRMEVMAALEGLFLLTNPSKVKIYSDSVYVCDTINKGWVNKWIEEADYSKKHYDLWRMIYNLSKIHDVSAEHVKGHNGHYYNELVDSLAQGESIKLINESEGFTFDDEGKLFSVGGLPFDEVDNEKDVEVSNEAMESVESNEVETSNEIDNEKEKAPPKVKSKKKAKKKSAPSSKKKFYYAVAIGRKVGIFPNWNECNKQVNKFKGAKFKKFETKYEAEEFIEKYN